MTRGVGRRPGQQQEIDCAEQVGVGAAGVGVDQAGVEPQPGSGGVGARRGFGLAPGARLGRQRGVAPRRAGDAVREPGRSGHDLAGCPVEGRQSRGRQVLDDRRLHERVGDAQLPGAGGVDHAGQIGPDHLVQLGQRVVRAGHLAHGGQGCRQAEHDERLHQTTGALGAPGHARQDQPGVRLRRRQGRRTRQRLVGQLAEQRRDMERAPAGVRLQPVRSAGRQGSSEPGRQRLDGVTVEPGQLDAGAPVVRLGQPDEPGRQAVHVVEPAGDHQDDAIRPEAAGGEGQRLEGRAVGPVGIVDHDDERIGQLGLVDEPQQRPAGVERIGPRRGHQARDRVGVERRGRGQSLDHPVVDPGLGGIARHRHHRGVGSTQQRAHQVRLPDARIAGDQHHRGEPAAGTLDRRVEPRQLGGPADDGGPVARTHLGGPGPSPTVISSVPPAPSARCTTSWARDRTPTLA